MRECGFHSLILVGYLKRIENPEHVLIPAVSDGEAGVQSEGERNNTTVELRFAD